MCTDQSKTQGGGRPEGSLTVLGSGVNPCSEPPRTQTHVAPPPRMLTALSTRVHLLWIADVEVV